MLESQGRLEFTAGIPGLSHWVTVPILCLMGSTA